MALPEALFNVRPFTSSLVLSPSSQDTWWPRVPWPQEAADTGHVAGLGGGLALPRARNGGWGADSYGNFFYLTCYKKVHPTRRETITSL